MKILLSSIALVLLAGCASTSNQTQTSRIFEENNKILNDSLADSTSCNSKLYNSSAGQIVIEQVLFLRSTSKNKYELMQSKKKLNSEQKAALQSFLQGLPECRQLRLAGLNRVDPILAIPYNNYASKIDAIILALLDGKFTIGDANIAKDKAMTEAMNETAAAENQYRQRLQAMENEEIARRQRAAAIMMPYLMQQNAINAQNQQNLYNQQMQNIRANTPVLTPPVTTNCQAIGNQINCVSR